MQFIKTLKDALIKAAVPDKMRDQYEHDVMGGSFDVFKLPKTSRYYQAYYIGFLHGAESQKKGDHTKKMVELTIDRVIDGAKEREKAAAAAAVDPK
jgi:hypothetical protein